MRHCGVIDLRGPLVRLSVENHQLRASSLRVLVPVEHLGPVPLGECGWTRRPPGRSRSCTGRLPGVRVAEGIHRLGDRYVNWYVIEQGGRLTVLDAGFPAHWSQLPRLLQTIGRSLDDVDAVLLTHHHPDHLGSAERIRRESGARVLTHDAAAAGARRGGQNPSTL